MPFLVALAAALVKIVVVLGVTLITVPMLVWLERKLLADFQARVGPSRVGPFGILQSFVDGLKLITKEAIVPRDADRLLYFAGPVAGMIPALAVGAVIPFGADLKLWGYTHRLLIADLPVGVLLVLALTSLSVYGIVLSGWSSSNKYSLLGGLRSSAQMVSYELPMGLSVVVALMIASHHTADGVFSLSFRGVVDSQTGWIWDWVAFNPRFFFLGFIAMVMFYICGLAETNRAPFDLPEAETELIGGYHTEYGGLRWAMFFMGEYAAMLNVSAVTATLFLGGWRSPYPDPFEQGSLLSCVHGVFWFAAKVMAIIVIYMWIRATLPRLRYDRLMSFGWKVLIPAGLLNIFLVAGVLSIFFAEPAPAVLRGVTGSKKPVVIGAPPGGPGQPAPPAAPAGAQPGSPPAGGTGLPGDAPSPAAGTGLPGDAPPPAAGTGLPGSAPPPAGAKPKTTTPGAGGGR